MDMTTLFFPQGNDIIVTARFPEIPDGTGLSSRFLRKPDKTTPDSDPAVKMYTSTIISDTGNPGQTMSQYNIPAADNGVPGAQWWRVDVIDAANKKRTANSGPLLVEAV